MIARKKYKTYSAVKYRMQITDCALNSNPKNGTCFNKEHIQEITKAENVITIAEVKTKLNCSDDLCIIEKVKLNPVTKQKIEREALKTPADSVDGNYWINNTEIDTCMSQLRYMYPGFSHTFIHMVDLEMFIPANYNSFEYEVYDVEEINFDEEVFDSLVRQHILKGKPLCCESRLSTVDNRPFTSFGVVCNTDSSKGKGLHWFCIYLSMDQKDENGNLWIRIELFNSSGNDISNSKFNSFWHKKAMEISKMTGFKCTYEKVSSISHQRDDTGNCGAYSLYYIYSRLNGKMPSDFDKSVVRDEDMEEFRKVLFKVNKDNHLSI